MSGPGELIDGRYRLDHSVGSGGMGIVYQAVDEQTGRRVAVKVLHSRVVGSTDARARLQREIDVLSRLHSPYIAELLAAGYLEDDSPYFVMEFLEGRDLKAELRRRGPLPHAEAAAYLVQACRGIAVAHAQGIIHRDLKPHNLFLIGLDAV
ncbi:MAG TPA: serine/threonine-protein kinase, partial [Polyangiaceae bacterium]